jgi:molybdopterin synthase catalytic subunit
LFQFAIDALKSNVPIWKKEIYEDGSEWKANPECPWTEKASTEKPLLQKV